MEELELREYWRIIRRRIWLVIAIPVIAAIVSGVFSEYVIKPSYQANTTLIVNLKPSDPNLVAQSITQDITASQNLVATYSNIIKSRTVAQKVIDQLHLSLTTTQLDGMVSVSSPTQSQVIDVAVTGPNQPQAADIANALASTFRSEARTIINAQSVQIIDPAITQNPPVPVKPNKKLNVAIAFILGLMVSVGLAFLLEYLDNRFRSEEDVERLLHLPVLAAITEYPASEAR